MRECERVGPWLSLNGYQRLRSNPSSLPHDDPLVNRLLSDPYICIYTADQVSHCVRETVDTSGEYCLFDRQSG